MRLDLNLYIGTAGTLCCIDQANGKELWRTKLKGSGFVTILVEPPDIYAHTDGHLFCVDAATGKLLWENNLPGLGYKLASLATTRQSASPVEAAQQEEDEEEEARRRRD
jgi:outer membrane protein assembly factor BamB